jgi:hypothetical protein
MEQSLQGRDLVLSCEEPGAWGQLHNAAMASTAGHPFWLAVLQKAMRRSPAAVAASSGWAHLQIWKLWRRMPFFNGLLDVLRTTGPILLTDVYRVRASCSGGSGYAHATERCVPGGASSALCAAAQPVRRLT